MDNDMLAKRGSRSQSAARNAPAVQSEPTKNENNNVSNTRAKLEAMTRDLERKYPGYAQAMHTYLTEVKEVHAGKSYVYSKFIKMIENSTPEASETVFGEVGVLFAAAPQLIEGLKQFFPDTSSTKKLTITASTTPAASKPKHKQQDETDGNLPLAGGDKKRQRKAPREQEMDDTQSTPQADAPVPKRLVKAPPKKPVAATPLAAQVVAPAPKQLPRAPLFATSQNIAAGRDEPQACPPPPDFDANGTYTVFVEPAPTALLHPHQRREDFPDHHRLQCSAAQQPITRLVTERETNLKKIFDFCRLPKKIRHRIYLEVFTLQPEGRISKIFMGHHSYAQPSPPDGGHVPALLLSNQAVHDEAYPVWRDATALEIDLLAHNQLPPADALPLGLFRNPGIFTYVRWLTLTVNVNEMGPVRTPVLNLRQLLRMLQHSKNLKSLYLIIKHELTRYTKHDEPQLVAGIIQLPNTALSHNAHNQVMELVKELRTLGCSPIVYTKSHDKIQDFCTGDYLANREGTCQGEGECRRGCKKLSKASRQLRKHIGKDLKATILANASRGCIQG